VLLRGDGCRLAGGRVAVHGLSGEPRRCVTTQEGDREGEDDGSSHFDIRHGLLEMLSVDRTRFSSDKRL
jgi:hypothetical protein